MSNNFVKRALGGTLNLLFFAMVLILPVGVFRGIFYIFSGDLKIQTLFSGISMFILGVSCLLIIMSLIGILDSTYNSIFITKNVDRFKRIGYCLLVNTIIDYVTNIGSGWKGTVIIDLGFCFFITFSMAIFFVSSLTSFVIADAFEKAIKIKEDNELTI